MGQVPRDDEGLRAAFEAWRARHMVDHTLAAFGQRWIKHVKAKVADDVVAPKGVLDGRYITSFLTRLDMAGIE